MIAPTSVPLPSNFNITTTTANNPPPTEPPLSPPPSTLRPLPLPPADAIALNEALLQTLHQAAAANPTGDLLAAIPAHYRRQHRKARNGELSWAGQINWRTVNGLVDRLEWDPDVHLLDAAFPEDYGRSMHNAKELARKQVQREQREKQQQQQRQREGGQTRVNGAQGATAAHAGGDHHQDGSTPFPPTPAATTATTTTNTPEPPEPPDFRTRLDIVDTAEVKRPLATPVAALLAQHGWTAGPQCLGKEVVGAGAGDGAGDAQSRSLACALRRVMWTGEKLWQFFPRGIVVQVGMPADGDDEDNGNGNGGSSASSAQRCPPSIVIKLNIRSNDLTEHATLVCLAEHAPTIPAPRPLGVVTTGPFQALFMTLVPGTPLAAVWPSISAAGKVTLQRQLDNVLQSLRTLRLPEGPEEGGNGDGDGNGGRRLLGGVDGGGVKDYRVDETAAVGGITTAREFDAWQFSVQHRASPSYVRLLEAFLAEDRARLRGAVFTHGDLKKENILVLPTTDDGDGADTGTDTSTDIAGWRLSGIIDWEDSGFYPDYYESTTLANWLDVDAEHDDDWFLYLPDVVSPLRWPVRWLVDRLWGNLLWNWRSDVAR